MNTLKKCILLGILILNLIPYMQDGNVNWTTLKSSAQTYTWEGEYSNGLFKCVNTLNSADWFESYYTTCPVGEICMCKECRKNYNCNSSTCTNPDCISQYCQCNCGGIYKCGNVCTNESCAYYNQAIEGNTPTGGTFDTDLGWDIYLSHQECIDIKYQLELITAGATGVAALSIYIGSKFPVTAEAAVVTGDCSSLCRSIVQCWGFHYIAL
jgi:hypothetical protein